MKWNTLQSANQLELICEESKTNPILIFKHSTRCSISRMALDRLERTWNERAGAIKPYYLDLIAYRGISNQVAALFDVEHESPQVLLIRDGKAVYDGSHFEISLENILGAAKLTKAE